jgi:hypothetical protein
VHAVGRKVNRGRIEAQQHMGAAVVEVGDLVDLVGDREGGSEKTHQRA